MIDQLIIGNKASYDDFEANVKERKISAPKKKSIKETVPFSNVTYDFTAINGEIYWEERTLEYVFEITANTPEELEEKKQLFVSWIMNVMNEELHDPFIHGYHFDATFDSIDIDDSEIEKSTIKVAFTAYPYMIANTPRKIPVKLGELPTINADGTMTALELFKTDPGSYYLANPVRTIDVLDDTENGASEELLTASGQVAISYGSTSLEKIVVLNGYAYLCNVEDETLISATEATTTETTYEATVTIQNDSSHRITPTFVADVPLTITMDDTTYTMNAGTFTDSSIMFAVGANTLTVKTNTVGTLTIEFYEEVF